jgi:hypothetical protein
MTDILTRLEALTQQGENGPLPRPSRQGRTDLFRHRTGILFKDFAGRDLHVDHGGGDVSVSHQLHEGSPLEWARLSFLHDSRTLQFRSWRTP